MAFKFEKLRVWEKAIEVSGLIGELTETFPNNEQFVLSSQIKRAADSIALNIAEGSTGQTNKEYKRFLGIAIRFGIEVVCCLYIAKRRKLMDQDRFDSYYNELTGRLIGIQALRKSIK